MAFKDPRTAEEREQAELRLMLKKQQDKASRRHGNIYAMARGFYDRWVGEDEKVSKDEALRYFERAWTAAEVFVDGAGSRKDPILEGEED